MTAATSNAGFSSITSFALNIESEKLSCSPIIFCQIIKLILKRSSVGYYVCTYLHLNSFKNIECTDAKFDTIDHCLGGSVIREFVT